MLTENERINALYYDKTASDYETTGRINQPGNKERIRRLLAELIDDSNLRILDVCCGAGLYLSLLKQRVRPQNLYGVDISWEMLKVSRSQTARLQQSSAYALPFADESFDWVTCSSALHHLEDLPSVLREIYRVLKPGGRFLSDYDNNVHFAWFHNALRKLRRGMLVYPIFLKLAEKMNLIKTEEKSPPSCHDGHSFENLPLGELHRRAEVQNYHHDGIQGYRLKRILKEIGFREVRLFAYHSWRWNDGVPFNLYSSLWNNKLYSVSQK